MLLPAYYITRKKHETKNTHLTYIIIKNKKRNQHQKNNI